MSPRCSSCVCMCVCLCVHARAPHPKYEILMVCSCLFFFGGGGYGLCVSCCKMERFFCFAFQNSLFQKTRNLPQIVMKVTCAIFEPESISVQVVRGFQCTREHFSCARRSVSGAGATRVSALDKMRSHFSLPRTPPFSLSPTRLKRSHVQS